MMETLEILALQFASDKKEAGYLIYSVHMAAMLSAPILFMMVPMLRIPIMISFFPLFMYHIIYKQCPLARIERKLHGDDVTVIDPFIRLFGFTPNKKTRAIFQVLLSTLFMAGMIYVISIKST